MSADSRSLAVTIGLPIIIVPSLPTSAISIGNVKELLEDGHFVSALERKDQSAKRPKSVVIAHKDGEKERRYEVFDQPNLLAASDWERVIAVFALGQAWQFKDWPAQWQSPTDVFNKSCGFFLMFDDESVPLTIKNWDVKVLKISRNKRHLDSQMQYYFWMYLDQALRTRLAKKL